MEKYLTSELQYSNPQNMNLEPRLTSSQFSLFPEKYDDDYVGYRSIMFTKIQPEDGLGSKTRIF